MIRTTLGQLLINDALPEELRDHQRVLDKKGLSELLLRVAKETPDKYREVAKELSDVGRDSAFTTGGTSFGLKHLRKSKLAKQKYAKLTVKLNQILGDRRLSDDQREERILVEVGRVQKALEGAVYDESFADGNPLALQVLSGSRGNKTQLRGLIAGDGFYVDNSGDTIGVPILRSYSEGLSPAEYWAGTFGARKGVLAMKIATADAGYLAKQMNQMAHRLVITKHDGKDRGMIGLPVDTLDPDNEGSLLATNVGGYKRNTVLTPKMLRGLHDKGFERILVRSPLAGGPADGGIYAMDTGIRERGGFSPTGDYVGMAAAQALTEPLTQGQMSSRHTGGVAGADAAVTGFKYINQLVQVPKRFRAGASHAQVDGKVQRIEDAPQGGKYVWVEGEQHYVGVGMNVSVKAGDAVEAGDVLSDGIPNPSEIVKHKGVGEGRRYFTNAFRNAYSESGLGAHRRNVELLTRGLINHVRVTSEFGDHVPDDILPYSVLEHTYKPRVGAQIDTPVNSGGRYLERPILHYSIGTRIKPSVLKELQSFGIKQVETHDEPPPFSPEMVRATASISHDPDWMTRMLGSGQKKSLLGAVHTGGISNTEGTSFVPALAAVETFGRSGLSKGWK
jgi:hypothetical protein